MRNLRDAALRGVRVRLLVDDLYTTGGDPMFRGLAAFPNVEVRLFNPFCCARQSTASKYAASIADFRRLNHRMHNKLFIADGAVAVMGGRNIADEYFTRSATSNFVDMDVFVVGPVVRQLSDIFDVYWNSPQAYPVEVILGDSGDSEETQRGFDHLVDDGDQMMPSPPPFDILGYGPIKTISMPDDWACLGTAAAFADVAGGSWQLDEMARSMSAQMNVMDRVMESKSDVVICSVLHSGVERVQAFGDLRKRMSRSRPHQFVAANDAPGSCRYARAALYCCEPVDIRAAQRIQHNERLALPGASLGRCHEDDDDQSMVYIGSVNLRSKIRQHEHRARTLRQCPEPCEGGHPCHHTRRRAHTDCASL